MSIVTIVIIILVVGAAAVFIAIARAFDKAVFRASANKVKTTLVKNALEQSNARST